MLLSIGGRDRTAPFLRPLEGVHYGFEPTAPVSPSEAGHQSTGRMYELVIYSDSGDCPDASLRHSEDGHFHTGDLFQEPIPGAYVFRGRDDDWIKSENSLRCDTKYVYMKFVTLVPHADTRCSLEQSRIMFAQCAVH